MLPPCHDIIFTASALQQRLRGIYGKLIEFDRVIELSFRLIVSGIIRCIDDKLDIILPLPKWYIIRWLHGYVHARQASAFDLPFVYVLLLMPKYTAIQWSKYRRRWSKPPQTLAPIVKATIIRLMLRSSSPRSSTKQPPQLPSFTLSSSVIQQWVLHASKFR